MKNLLKSFLLVASVCLLMAGCSNLGNATVDAEGISEGYSWLTISVDDLNDMVVAKRSAARTINPDSLSDHEVYDSEDDDYPFTKFVLKGKSTITGADLLDADDNEGIQLTFDYDHDSDSTTPNAAKAQIPFGAWDLTLEAYVGSVVVLQGRTYVDLKTPKTSVAFTLTTDNLTTPGSVSLGGTFVDADNVAATYTAGLFSLSDGSLKYPVLAAGTELTKTPVPDTGKTFAYSATAVKPGRYSFQLRFYNSSDKQVGFWEDVVVVAPGRATTDTSITCGNIIMQLPASPTNLMAYVVDDSEDEDGNYTVVLKWKDNSHNEENFVIYIDKYTTTALGVGSKSTYAVLGVEPSESATDKKEIFWESDKNAGGSIRTSSEECRIKLPLGKTFDVSIRAQNFVGLSKIAVTSTDSVSYQDKAYDRISATGTVDNATAITSERINRMAVKYDLNNGTLRLADGSEKTGVYTIYGSIYDTAIAGKTPATLLPIDNALDTANHLVSGRYPFAEWVNLDDTAVTVLTAAGAEVKATYNKSTNITYAVDNKYYTVNVTATCAYEGTKKNKADVEFTSTTNIVSKSIPAKGNEDITFAVTSTKPDTSDGAVAGSKVAVDWIRVSITNLPGDPIDSGKVTGATYTFTGTNGLMSGPHTVTVKAHITGEPAGTVYEFTFPIGLER